jgi:hypothetical protein
MKETRSRAIDTLLRSEEPSIRWKVLVNVLGEDPDSAKVRDLREQIRTSPRVTALLAGRDRHFTREANVYAKYRGAHWTLAALADLGYPPGDESLFPMCRQVLDHWLSDSFYREFESKSAVPKHRSSEGVPIIRGRYRRCASQQGNALLSLTRLGLAESERGRLAERLLHWQWPDGGWNCDRNPSADTSSFMESLLPMCGLAAHADAIGDKPARDAAFKASEVFLSRRLFKRRSDGKIMYPNFLMFHYPLFWHYDVLGGLKAMAEMKLLHDPRCADALEVLERKELPNGGWAANGRLYKVAPGVDTSERFGSTMPVGWGGIGRNNLNQWTTADALYILRTADRL